MEDDMVEASAEVTTLMTHYSVSSVHASGNMECVLTETTRLALVPQGQESCLLITDSNGQPKRTLSIKVEKILLESQFKNEYLTT